jgi:hypothetical protein
VIDSNPETKLQVPEIHNVAKDSITGDSLILTEAKQIAAVKRAKSNANLKLFKKGEPRKAGPGRPKRKRFIEAIQHHYETGPYARKHMRQLVRAMERKQPSEISHYLAGKPVERIDLVANVEHSVNPAVVAAAQVALMRLYEAPQIQVVSEPHPSDKNAA